MRMKPYLRRGADQRFRKRVRLGEPEPMIIAHRERHVGALEMLERRDDVEHRQPLHPLRVIQRQPVRNAPATIVTGQQEARMPKLLHHRNHVGRHRPLGIECVIRAGRRLERSAIATQIRAYHAEPVGPARARSRGATSHASAGCHAAAEGRSRSAMAQPDATAGNIDLRQGESRETTSSVPFA